MLKFLLILALSLYVLSKIGGFFFRAGASSQQNRYQQRKPSDGNINVDSSPRKDRKGGNIKGGDYVDYEEVK
jgi:hypothetical protein